MKNKEFDIQLFKLFQQTNKISLMKLFQTQDNFTFNEISVMFLIKISVYIYIFIFHFLNNYVTRTFFSDSINLTINLMNQINSYNRIIHLKQKFNI